MFDYSVVAVRCVSYWTSTEPQPGLAPEDIAVGRKEAIRFLQHTVSRQGCTSQPVHDFLLMLLVLRYVEVGPGRYWGPATSSTRILNPRLFLVKWHPMTWRTISARPYPEDPNALMRYVGGAGAAGGGSAYYDQRVAFQLCEGVGALRAAIHIHCDLNDLDRAVDLALQAGNRQCQCVCVSVTVCQCDCACGCGAAGGVEAGCV